MIDLSVADFPTTDPSFNPEIDPPRTDVLYAYYYRVDLRHDLDEAGNRWPATHLTYLTKRVRLEKTCQNWWGTSGQLCQREAHYVATLASDQYGQRRYGVCSDCCDDMIHDACAGYLGDDTTLVMRHPATGTSVDF
jgi:hypothetical protein